MTDSRIRPADRVSWSRSNVTIIVKTAMLGNPRLGVCVCLCVCARARGPCTLVTEYRSVVQACTPLEYVRDIHTFCAVFRISFISFIPGINTLLQTLARGGCLSG